MSSISKCAYMATSRWRVPDCHIFHKEMILSSTQCITKALLGMLWCQFAELGSIAMSSKRAVCSGGIVKTIHIVASETGITDIFQHLTDTDMWKTLTNRDSAHTYLRWYKTGIQADKSSAGNLISTPNLKNVCFYYSG